LARQPTDGNSEASHLKGLPKQWLNNGEEINMGITFENIPPRGPQGDKKIAPEELGYFFERRRGRLEIAELNFKCPVCDIQVPSCIFHVIFTAWTPEEDIEAINMARFHNRKLPKRLENSIRYELLQMNDGTGRSLRLKFMPELDGVDGWYDEEAGEARCGKCCGVGE